MTGMNDFLSMLDSLATDCGPHEGTMMMLERYLMKDASYSDLLEEKFQSTDNDGLKELYASLITKVLSKPQYRDYLKTVHQWTDSDFKEVKA